MTPIFMSLDEVMSKRPAIAEFDADVTRFREGDRHFFEGAVSSFHAING
jgi:hypothetical protein